MGFATISEAAKILGFRSRSQLYQWINSGRLDEFLYLDRKGKKYLKLKGLREFMTANTVPRSNGVFS